MGDQAKDEVDRWGQLMEDRANLGFNSIIVRASLQTILWAKDVLAAMAPVLHAYFEF